MESQDPLFDELQDLVSQLGGEVSPLVSSVLEGLVATVESLQARVGELEPDQEQTHDVATTAVGTVAETQSRLTDLEDGHEKTRDIARSAVAKAEQETANPDQQEYAEHLPEGISPSSSPLDFFANCREAKIKDLRSIATSPK